MRVLVVDVQPDASLALADLLGALGVGAACPSGIDRADDGDTALAMIDQAEHGGHPYDLLLIDWVMPRLDGAAVLRALKERVGAKTPLAVIVSAYDSEIIHRAAEELGARHFLAKPVLPESLRGLVKWLAGDEPSDMPSQQPATAAVDLAGLRVLLVEDNPINQQLAVELMEGRQAEVHVANNGQEAIDRLTEHPADYYSVVLMDLQMPVMDGYEATRRLRLDSRFVNLPIIAISAHAMADERERCQVLGMNAHISKPIDPDLLYATLAEFNLPGAALRPGPTTSLPVRAMAEEVHIGDHDLPRIVGLDVRAGLHHADGNAYLYARLLRRFARDYSDFTTTVERTLTAGNWDEATRQAHTLKGLAASLGANQLQPRAAALEKAARDRDDVEARGNLTRIAEHLAPLVSALRMHFGIEGDAATQPAANLAASAMPASADAATAGPPNWLPRLRDLLQQADVEAKELWESNRDEIAAGLPLQLAQSVSLAIENFEFDVALRLLAEIQSDATVGS